MFRSFKLYTPQVHAEAFVADSAAVIGRVVLEEGVSIWYRAVLRGDVNWITIGKGSNIQDSSIVHGAVDYKVTVGRYVLVGHEVVLQGCTIGDYCFIGMKSIILDGAEIGAECMLGARTVVPGGVIIPPQSLVAGTPARVIRPLTTRELQWIKRQSLLYVRNGQSHRETVPCE